MRLIDYLHNKTLPCKIITEGCEYEVLSYISPMEVQLSGDLIANVTELDVTPERVGERFLDIMYEAEHGRLVDRVTYNMQKEFKDENEKLKTKE